MTSLTLLSCGNLQNRVTSAQTSINLDSIDYVVLKFDTNYYWIGERPSKDFELSIDDIKECEILIAELINKYNTEQEKRFIEMNAKYPGQIDKMDYIIDLKRYKRQYMSTISLSRQMIVYINFFCYQEGMDYWKSELVQVEDGGNCFFHLKINLTTKIVSELNVNGLA